MEFCASQSQNHYREQERVSDLGELLNWGGGEKTIISPKWVRVRKSESMPG